YFSSISACLLFFFCVSPASTDIYTLSLHDALPISLHVVSRLLGVHFGNRLLQQCDVARLKTLLQRLWKGLEDFLRVQTAGAQTRSEEHTSELQSRENLVCRLLLEKKKKKQSKTPTL